MSRALRVVALALLVAGCSSARQDSPTSDSVSLVQSLQLRTSDVPSGFYLENRYHLTHRQTAQWENLNQFQYVRHGGGPSVAETFVLRHPIAEGMTFISTHLMVFASAESAKWGFRQLRSALAHSGTIGTIQKYVDARPRPTPLATIVNTIKHPPPPPVSRYQSVAVPLVANQDAGFTNTSAAYAGEYVFTNQVVVFRQGRYCAIVHAAGNWSQVPMSAALALARRMEERIRTSKM